MALFRSHRISLRDRGSSFDVVRLNNIILPVCSYRQVSSFIPSKRLRARIGRIYICMYSAIHQIAAPALKHQPAAE